MSVIGSNILAGASGNQVTGYNLTRSLRFRSSASAYLNRTPGSASNRKTFTWSGWVKRGKLSASQGIFEAVGSGGLAGKGTFFEFGSTNQLNVQLYDNTYNTVWNTTAVYRDPSAWYHVVLSVDTTQASPANMVKIYINGVQQSLTVTHYSATLPQNYDTFINNTNAHSFNSYVSSNYGDQYYAEVNFVDGQALTPSDFGETSATTGVWIPKAYTGTYGTNGFYLDFEDTSSVAALGYDAAGSNDWTVNNVSLTSGATYDSMTDVPTLTSATAANYATFNPLVTSANTFTNGNLTVSNASGSNYIPAFSTIVAPSGGKYYYEFTSTTASFPLAVGVAKSTDVPNSAEYIGYTSTQYAYNPTNGNKLNNNTNTAYGSSFTANDVIGVALDLVNGTLVFYKNNVSQGTAFSSLTGDFYFAVGTVAGGSTCTGSVNFGQRPFAYTPPSGFVALNTFNLPTPTIGATASTQANKYMDATLYTGTGASQSVVNASGFRPDLVWLKARSQAYFHNLNDSVRGVNKRLFSNNTDAEDTTANCLTAFNSNGFTVGTNQGINENTTTYVGWQWQAGQGTTSSNTDGTITSTVSANTSAGFSVVTYTGTGSAATIGHGLGVAPSMVIVKNRDAADAWQVYHAANTAAPETDYLVLNTDAATADAADRWNDTLPTSTVFSIGNGVEVNTNTEKYVAYCWSEVAGYSKFASYTGNGSADGPFVYTGFRPKFVLVKSSSTQAGWYLLDSSRNTFNVVDNFFSTNDSSAENGGSSPVTFFDFTSNGFKVRNSGTFLNGSGTTYIYAAFAETPQKFALGR